MKITQYDVKLVNACNVTLRFRQGISFCYHYALTSHRLMISMSPGTAPEAHCGRRQMRFGGRAYFCRRQVEPSKNDPSGRQAFPVNRQRARFNRRPISFDHF